MVVLEGDKKPEPKPVEPVMEKEVTDEDMTHEACHMLFSAMSVLISSNTLWSTFLPTPTIYYIFSSCIHSIE